MALEGAGPGRRVRHLIVQFSVAVLGGGASASEGTWTSVIQPVPNSGPAVIAADGNVMVMGDPFDDVLGLDAGRAWIYERSGSNWVLAATLHGAAPKPARRFGYAVDVSANRVVVSAPTVINYPGSAWVEVFDRIGGVWTNSATLTPSDPKNDRRYGFSVAVHGDRVVVGAEGHDAFGTLAGAVYVYQQVGSTWTEAKVFAADADSHDRFGSAVDLHQGTLAVGAADDEAHSFKGGSAYLFEASSPGWTQRYKCVPPAADVSTHLGSDIAVQGDLMVVGARGTPYVVQASASGWTAATSERLIAGGASFISDFGRAVAIEAGKVYVSAPIHSYPAFADADFGCPFSLCIPFGCVFRFEYIMAAWRPTMRWAGASGSYLGEDVAVAGNHVLAAISACSVAVCEEPQSHAPAFGCGWRGDIYAQMPPLLCAKNPAASGGVATIEVYRSTFAPFFLLVGTHPAITTLIAQSADPHSAPAELYLAPLLALVGPFAVDDVGSARFSVPVPPVTAPLDLVVQAIAPQGTQLQLIKLSNAVQITIP